MLFGIERSDFEPPLYIGMIKKCPIVEWFAIVKQLGIVWFSDNIQIPEQNWYVVCLFCYIVIKITDTWKYVIPSVSGIQVSVWYWGVRNSDNHCTGPFSP